MLFEILNGASVLPVTRPSFPRKHLKWPFPACGSRTEAEEGDDEEEESLFSQLCLPLSLHFLPFYLTLMFL